MLKNLEVLNGEMSLYYDKFVDTYTVWVNGDVEKLDLKYELEDDVEINVINNENLDYGLNFVYLDLQCDDEVRNVVLNVYKEESKQVFIDKVDESKLEIKNEYPEYTPYLIFGGCFLVIIVVFWLLFGKNKRKMLHKK